jgi:polyferredoxin
MRRVLWIPWRWWRRAAQLVLLLEFLWLFRRTEYTGADQLAGGENIFFRLDPLAGAAAMLAARQFIALFWPALVLVALTLILGRFFCGWVCPLGTLLDYFHRLLRPLARRTNRLLDSHVAESRESSVNSRRLTVAGRAAKYFLLIAVLTAAVFAFPLVGLVDPFSLLVRGLAFWIDPMLFRGVDACFGWASEGWAADVLQPFVKKHLLPFRPMVFHLAGLSAAILAVVFALELVARRFWCRYVCPLGAGLGLLARWSLVKRLPVKVCKSCGECVATCRMDALDPAAGLSPEACNLCMECVDRCPQGIVKFAARTGESPIVVFWNVLLTLRVRLWWRRGLTRSVRSTIAPVDLSRRGVLVGIAAGAALPGIAWAVRLGQERPVPPDLLRPPGAADEQTFLGLCIRCGECMKVCLTNVLQPAIFQSGVEGLFSPRLIPRLIFQQSYCEYACTLCGQVCPTGAIPRLDEEAKHAHPTGKAYFDHNLCLPWAEKTPCIRCEEMCLAPEKAIKIRNTFKIAGKDGQEVEIQQPYVDRDLCVGCGICESNCTIKGTAGIRVFRVDAADPRTEFLLKPK